MAAPAPLDVIREKLHARSERIRRVALAHAAAHGTAAQSLAADVARMLEDPSAAVQWDTMYAFRCIGPGASDAVPILLAQRAKGAPEMLVTRATFCLGIVGPAAEAAVPVLLGSLPSDDKALEALLRIAPTHPDVLDAVIDAAFSPQFALNRIATQKLGGASDALVDAAFEAMEVRSTSEPGAVAKLLFDLGSKRPERAAPLLRMFLRNPTSPEARYACAAVAQLPAPRPPDLVAAVVRAAEVDVDAAISALEQVGLESSAAQAALLGVIDRFGDAAPRFGPEGARARTLVAAAKSLARACPTERALPPLLAWVTGAMKGESRRALYTIGDMLDVLAELGGASGEVHAALLEGVALAARAQAQNDSGALDLQEKLRQAFAKTTVAEELFAQAEALGMAREAPSDEGDDEPSESHAPELPELPLIDAPDPVGRVEALDAGTRDALNAMVIEGRAALGLDGSDPKAVAEAVERWLRKAHAAELDATEDDVRAVGAAYGAAVADAVGWAMAVYVWEEKPHLAVVSPDRAHVLLPLRYLARLALPRAQSTALLQFNMLVAGNLGEAPAGALSVIA